LLNLLLPVVIGSDPFAKELHETIEAAIARRPGPNRPRAGMPNEVRRSEVADGFVRLGELDKDAVHDLHVLLRHRLLLQPQSFAGLHAVSEYLPVHFCPWV